MMSKEMEDLIQAKAAAMADADGSPVGTIYVVGAVNALQTDLLAARDQLLSPGAEIIVETVAAEAPVSEESPPAPEPEAAPEVAPETTAEAAATAESIQEEPAPDAEAAAEQPAPEEVAPAADPAAEAAPEATASESPAQ